MKAINSHLGELGPIYCKNLEVGDLINQRNSFFYVVLENNENNIRLFDLKNKVQIKYKFFDEETFTVKGLVVKNVK